MVKILLGSVLLVGIIAASGFAVDYTSKTTEPKSSTSEVDEISAVKFLVTMLDHRTYGRVFLEKMSTTTAYQFILAEPLDVNWEGALRYSTTTRAMEVGQHYIVSGTVSQPCFDKVANTDGELVCVAWLELSTVDNYDHNPLDSNF
jgi:hypothetical protein